jgi:dCTP deaminase
MSMLSDRDLMFLSVNSQLVEPFDPDNCEGATINLTLDPILKKYISAEPLMLGKQVEETDYKVIDLSKDQFWLEPNESVLIQTHEFIQVPSDKAARIYERYGVKSLGLMISPAHYMNPGYRGKISLLAVNHTNVRFKLVPYVKICQLAIFNLSSEPLKPYEKQDAHYMDSMDVSISKLHLDKEIQDFLTKKGLNKVTESLAKNLGEHLREHVKASAKRLADILREEEGGAKK